MTDSPSISKLDPKTDGSSANILEQNIDQLRQLYPEVFTESSDPDGPRWKVDFDSLRELLGDFVEDNPERYSFNWHGKARAKRIAQTPSTGTLRPCPEESVNWDTTKNIFIEGDNLEVLKLLQKSYHKRVKLIYIDPPYNTGKEFIYPDKFQDNLDTYLRYTGQIGKGGLKISANSETGGRYHTNWLNMMYPRLTLARNLLRDDGVMMISIDDHEQCNLRQLLNEILGEENFIAELVWEKTRKNDAKLFSVGHEYVLVYARNFSYLQAQGTIWREPKPGAKEILSKWKELAAIHSEDYPAIEADLQSWYRSLAKDDPSRKLSRYKHVDAFGPWRDRDISWPGGGGPRYDVIHPTTGKPCKVPERGWGFASPESMAEQIAKGLIVFREDHSMPPFRKAHLLPIPGEEEANTEDDSYGREEDAGLLVMSSVIYKQSQVATRYLRNLMGAKVFDNPKDHQVLARLISYVTDDDSIIVDFFCGSGSTAEAVLSLNDQTENSNRQFVMVQLPEQIAKDKKSQSAAYKFCNKFGIEPNIASLARFRLRKAHVRYSKDSGFKTFRLAETNLNQIATSSSEFDLLESINGLSIDSVALDVVYELLIKFGLDLVTKVELRKIESGELFVVGGGALMVFLGGAVTVTTAEAILSVVQEFNPELVRVIFNDSEFADDVAKTNVFQLLRQQGVTDVRTL